MIKYRKFCDDEFFNTSDPGNRTFHPVVMADPNGSEYDIKYSDDVVDIQDQIDSFKDSTDINLIVDRFTNGDLNAIGSIGVYDFENAPIVDTTIFPEDIHKANEILNAVDFLYDHLSPELKAKYSNLYEFFDSDDYNKDMAEQYYKVGDEEKGEVTE